jgi:alpha-glucosidase (family GH31 glycosyl hydrolase)
MNAQFRIVVMTIILVGVLLLAWEQSVEPVEAEPDWQTHEPSAWILGPIQGADGKENALRINLTAIEMWDLPVTVFHFDAPDWQKCTGNGEFRYSDSIIQRMRARKIRALFWTVPLIGLSCPEYQVALQNNYFVKDTQGNVIVTSNFTGHGSWIDFDNPDAIAFYHSLLDRVRLKMGDLMGGFYTDSVRPDDTTGQVAYGEKYSLSVLEYTRAHIPDGEVVMKRYGVNGPSDEWMAANAHIAYVNDLPTNFAGMITGIRRVFDTTHLMPLPYNEFSGFSNNPPDAETYIRRMHWGAMQPVMENVPKTKQPWDSIFPPQVMQVYQYYSTLHRELAPYLGSYDRAAYETKTPILRNMNSARFTAQLGDEIFVKYVTSYTSRVRVKFPPGEWINYWDESQVFPGSSTAYVSVPLGREPIFIKRGAIIPMEVRNNYTGHGTTASQNALTVNVFPTNHSTFRYWDPKNGWVTFDVKSVKKRLTLCTVDQVTSRPIIYRISNVKKKPNFVKQDGGAVGVNTKWGTHLPERASEQLVGQTQKGWFYDAAAKRLIVKVKAVGTNCPAP